MSPPSNDTPTPLVGLPRLDGEPGPARWASSQDTATLVAATLGAHKARKRRRSNFMQLAAGLTLLLGLSAAVSATWLLRSRPAPLISPPVKAVAVQAPAEPEAQPEATPAEEAEQAPETSAAPAANRVHASVSDLLAQANQLRRQGHWSQAAHAYDRAVRAAPHSQQAYAALVAAGGLYVDKLRDARRGAKFFQRALAVNPSGALAEEARWGLAQAYRAMHKRSAEHAALKAFLQHHPHGALAAEARSRLQEAP